MLPNAVVSLRPSVPSPVATIASMLPNGCVSPLLLKSVGSQARSVGLPIHAVDVTGAGEETTGIVNSMHSLFPLLHRDLAGSQQEHVIQLDVAASSTFPRVEAKWQLHSTRPVPPPLGTLHRSTMNPIERLKRIRRIQHGVTERRETLHQNGHKLTILARLMKMILHRKER